MRDLKKRVALTPPERRSLRVSIGSKDLHIQWCQLKDRKRISVTLS